MFELLRSIAHPALTKAAVFALLLGAVALTPAGADDHLDTCNGQAVTIPGTSAADTLVGTAGPDVIMGFGGDDVITGLGGNDTICGGAGADTVKAGPGNDKIFGEAGNDTLIGAKGNDRIKGGGGNDTINGNRGRDHLRGGAGDDDLNGGSGVADNCDAGAGNDTVIACEAGQGACPDGYSLDGVGQCLTLNLGCVLPNVEVTAVPGLPTFPPTTSCFPPAECGTFPIIDGGCEVLLP